MECPYCSEEFEDEHSKGVHIAENHVEEGKITRKKGNRDKKTNMVEEFDTEEE